MKGAIVSRCVLLCALLAGGVTAAAAEPPGETLALEAASAHASEGTAAASPGVPWLQGPLRAFGPGEKLVFALSWMGVVAGDSTMEVDAQPLSAAGAAGVVAGAGGEAAEREVWRVTSVTTSRTVADLVYKVRNRYETWIDPTTGLSLKYVIHQDEGGKKKDLVQIHDQKRSEVTMLVREKGVSTSRIFPVPAGSIDTLSALYVIRNRVLSVGDIVRYPVFEGKKSWELEVTVLAREEVETGAGTFDTFKLHPRIKHEGIFRSKGDLFVWVTADARHMPVLMKTSVPVGNITAELVRFTSGKAPPSTPTMSAPSGGAASPAAGAE